MDEDAITNPSGIAEDDVLFYLHHSAPIQKQLHAWRGSLARTTVADLHVWFSNVPGLTSFTVAFRRARGQVMHGTELSPVYEHSWSATLASLGLVSGDHILLGPSISLPCSAYRMPTLQAPHTQFELRVRHRLQATLIDNALHVWAPALVGATAKAIESLDGALPWRAAMTRVLAHHVATIESDGDEHVPNARYASAKAVKALMRLWAVLKPPHTAIEAVVAVHALTVLMSVPHALSAQERMTAFDVGNVFAPLCALCDHAFDASAATSSDFSKERAVGEEDPGAAVSCTPSISNATNATNAATQALVQLARVVKRATVGGTVLGRGLFLIPPAAYSALALLFARPFFQERGVCWSVVAPSAADEQREETDIDAAMRQFVLRMLDRHGHA
jgi:hypothetical protein